MYTVSHFPFFPMSHQDAFFSIRWTRWPERAIFASLPKMTRFGEAVPAAALLDSPHDEHINFD